MPYSLTSKLDPILEERERELLLAGFNYEEVAKAIGMSQAAVVKNRNRLVYRINIYEAFARRIEREGIPNRLHASDTFCAWFSGFADGEGHFGCHRALYSKSRSGVSSRHIFLQISVRDDDIEVINYIKDTLNAGFVTRSPQRKHTNPAAHYRIGTVADLAEVIVPLFEKYPLHTKKSREFAIWKTLVKQSYIFTLGGHLRRVSVTDEQDLFFDEGVSAIRKNRIYVARII